MRSKVDFSDITPLLLAKREPAQQDYELALANFERAKQELEAAESTLNRVDNMLAQCGYFEHVEEPTEELEPIDEVVEQAEVPATDEPFNY